MVQVFLRAILKTLKEPWILDNPDMTPAEMASAIVNELHIQEVGWICGNENTIKQVKECDDCFPIFRIKATEEM